MLARIYHHPQNKDENQSRLQKILQFWASKEVYDSETIHALEGEMLEGPPASSFSGPPTELSSVDPSSSGGGFLSVTVCSKIAYFNQAVSMKQYPRIFFFPHLISASA